MVAASLYASSAVASRLPTGSSSLTVTNSGGATDDVLVLFLYRYDTYASGDAGVPGGLSGWTNLFDSSSANARFGVWYKAYASGDVTLTSLTTGAYYLATMVTVRGATTTGITASAAATGTNTTVAGASLTAASGDLLLSSLATWDSFTSAAPTITHPSGMSAMTGGSLTDNVDLGGGKSYVQLFVDYQSPSAGATGTRSWTAADGVYNIAEMIVRNIIVPAAGGTTHTAAAAISSASTVTPAIAATRPAVAALSTTAALTATATRTQFAAAALSSASTVTPAFALTASADAAVSTSAAISASADVTPAPGSVTAAAVVLVAAGLSAAAQLERPLGVELSSVAALSASAVLDRPAAASVATALGISATLVLAGEIPTTSGYMRPASVASVMIRPRGGVTAPTLAALVSIDASTMTAVVDTALARPPLGVPVFVGGSASPVDAGLIASGLAYVWFADDGIHVQEAS